MVIAGVHVLRELAVFIIGKLDALFFFSCSSTHQFISDTDATQTTHCRFCRHDMGANLKYNMDPAIACICGYVAKSTLRWHVHVMTRRVGHFTQARYNLATLALSHFCSTDDAMEGPSSCDHTTELANILFQTLRRQCELLKCVKPSDAFPQKWQSPSTLASILAGVCFISAFWGGGGRSRWVWPAIYF